MAIIDGNYKFIDFDSLKGNLSDVFSRYFGVENRDEMRAKMDKIVHYPYHSRQFINEYYEEYAFRYYTDIYRRTLSKLGLEDSRDIEDCFLSGSYITDCAIRDIVYYEDSTVKCMTKDIDLDLLAQVCEPLGINTGTPEGDRLEVKKVYKTMLSAIREIEKEHPCDVFSDIQEMDKNHCIAIKKLLESVERLGLPVSKKDKELVHSPDFEMCDFPDLDAYGLYFTDTIDYDGIIMYFSEEYDKQLENSSANNVNTIRKRLQYLYKVGAEPKTIDPSIVYDDGYLISKKKIESYIID